MEEIKKLNIYQKLQKCRAELSKEKLTKSGENKFSNYKYFELGDFLPKVNKLFFENGLMSEFNLYEKIAKLRVIDSEEPTSQIIFTVPVAEAKINGTSPIQVLGGQITYLRRYLYINALEIAESDMVNPQNQNVSDEEQELKMIYMNKMSNLMLETSTDYEEIYKYFEVQSDSDMNLKQLKKAVAILERKKAKETSKGDVF